MRSPRPCAPVLRQPLPSAKPIPKPQHRGRRLQLRPLIRKMFRRCVRLSPLCARRRLQLTSRHRPPSVRRSLRPANRLNPRCAKRLHRLASRHRLQSGRRRLQLASRLNLQRAKHLVSRLRPRALKGSRDTRPHRRRKRRLRQSPHPSLSQSLNQRRKRRRNLKTSSRDSYRPAVRERGRPAVRFFWWTAGGSNPRPRHCERRALPTELAAHADVRQLQFTMASSDSEAATVLSAAFHGVVHLQ
jgi:hypothetical protein